MAPKNQPLVSIGIPVFNGADTLKQSLDSLILQDYENIEIIISDNASTDNTPIICQDYSIRDSRIRYSRATENAGPVWNFNRVFELSRGKYFMWAAHDDQRELSFVSACVEKMEQRPDAVLCQSYTAMFIEGREDLLCVARLDTFDNVTGFVGRYRETLKRFPATAFYGLYRSSAVRKTQLIRRTIASDLSFVQELSIYGNIIQVPEVLFNYFGRAKWNTIHQDYKAIYGKDVKPWWFIPFVYLFCDHWTRVGSALIPLSNKLRLWKVLMQHGFEHIVLKVLIKLVGLLCPKRLKNTLRRHIYRLFVHNPNVIVGSEEQFVERVIKPQLGW